MGGGGYKLIMVSHTRQNSDIRLQTMAPYPSPEEEWTKKEAASPQSIIFRIGCGGGHMISHSHPDWGCRNTLAVEEAKSKVGANCWEVKLIEHK